MKADYSQRAGEICRPSSDVRKAFFQTSKTSGKEPATPSLRAKKYDESQDLWQARVNKDWRFYSSSGMTFYYIVNIIPHPK